MCKFNCDDVPPSISSLRTLIVHVDRPSARGTPDKALIGLIRQQISGNKLFSVSSELTAPAQWDIQQSKTPNNSKCILRMGLTVNALALTPLSFVIISFERLLFPCGEYSHEEHEAVPL